MQTLICYVNEIGALDFLLPVLGRIETSHPNVLVKLILPEYVQKKKLPILLNSPTFIIRHESDIQSVLNKVRGKSSAICGILCSATSSQAEFLVSEFAKQNTIPIIHIVDSLYGYRSRFECDSLMIYHENVLLVDNLAKTHAVKDGFDEKKLSVVGHPGWEQQLNKLQRHPLPLSKNKSHNTLFLGAPVERDYGKSLGFDEYDSWSMIKEAQHKRPELIKELIYCPHPQQRLINHNVSVPILPFNMELLENYGQIFGIFSSPLLTAHLSKRLSVSVQPGNLHTDVCPFSKRGFIKKAASADELIDVILNKIDQIEDNTVDLMLHGSVDRTLRCLSHLMNFQ